jgi:hypothetical protein
MSSSSPKTSGNYQTNYCYQQSSYGNNVAQYPIIPTAHHHHQQQQLVNNNVQSLSPTSLSLVYGNQQQMNSPNILQARYQNEQINEKTSNSLTTVIANGQQSMTNNSAALAAATNYRRNFNACAKPPYR